MFQSLDAVTTKARSPLFCSLLLEQAEEADQLKACLVKSSQVFSGYYALSFPCFSGLFHIVCTCYTVYLCVFHAWNKGFSCVPECGYSILCNCKNPFAVNILWGFSRSLKQGCYLSAPDIGQQREDMEEKVQTVGERERVE